MNGESALPNLIVVGAPKCGTTSLHLYLGVHPQIFMSAVKEIGFFATRGPWSPFKNPEFHARDLSWYAEQFAQGRDRPVRGESSTNYSREAYSRRAASLIAEHLPGVKIIYMVRDPIERVRSDYVQLLHAGDIPPHITLTEILAYGREGTGSLAGWYQNLVLTGLYGRQLKVYTEHIPLTRIHIVPTRELQKNQRQTLQGVFRFLGVDHEFWDEEYSRHWNTRSDAYQQKSRINLMLMGLTHRLGIHRLLPTGMKQRAKRLFLQKLDYEVLSDLTASHREYLTELFAPDLDEFRAMTGIVIPLGSRQ